MELKKILAHFTAVELEELNANLTNVLVLFKCNMPSTYSEVERMMYSKEYMQLIYLNTMTFTELSQRQLNKQKEVQQ